MPPRKARPAQTESAATLKAHDHAAKKADTPAHDAIDVEAIAAQAMVADDTAEAAEQFNLGHFGEDSHNDVLTTYLRQIHRTALFTAEEELACARLAKQGDFSARQSMITHNLRLVVSIAKAYMGRGVPLSDLIEEGNIGLMHAIDKYDPERGFRFSTYASWWIRQSVDRALMYQGRTVRLPVNVVRQMQQVLRAKRSLERDATFMAQHPDGVAIDDIAHLLSWDKAQVSDLLGLAQAPKSLDAALDYSEANSQTMGDLLVDETTQEPAQVTQTHEVEHLLEEWIQTLPEREQQVLEGRFGLHEHASETLDVLSERLGLTRERVRQIQNQALAKLKRHLARRGISPQALL